jgi:hypothetical protein
MTLRIYSRVARGGNAGAPRTSKGIFAGFPHSEMMRPRTTI